MTWWKIFIKKPKAPPEVNHVKEEEKAMAKADEDLRDLEAKIAQDKEKAPDIARAVASSRRVQYRVHQFTQEISDSFGRLNHG